MLLQVAQTKAPLVLRELLQRLGESLGRCGDVEAALDALLAAAAAYGSKPALSGGLSRPSSMQPKQTVPPNHVASSVSGLRREGPSNNCQSPGDNRVNIDLMLEDGYVLQLAASQDLAKSIVESAQSPKLFS